MREIKIRSFKDASEGIIIFSKSDNSAGTLIIPEDMWITFLSALVDVAPGEGKTITLEYDEDADEE